MSNSFPVKKIVDLGMLSRDDREEYNKIYGYNKKTYEDAMGVWLKGDSHRYDMSSSIEAQKGYNEMYQRKIEAIKAEQELERESRRRQPLAPSSPRPSNQFIRGQSSNQNMVTGVNNNASVGNIRGVQQLRQQSALGVTPTVTGIINTNVSGGTDINSRNGMIDDDNSLPTNYDVSLSSSSSSHSLNSSMSSKSSMDSVSSGSSESEDE